MSVVATTAALTAGSAAGDEPTVLTPIGGGYETSTLAGFSRAAAEGASGPTVDLVVVPSAYGDSAKERKANLALAQQRTDQVDAACDAAVAAPFTGCTATLAVLLNRADALDPANSAALRRRPPTASTCSAVTRASRCRCSPHLPRRPPSPPPCGGGVPWAAPAPERPCSRAT